MKKLKWILMSAMALTMAVTTTACDDDDDDAPATPPAEVSVALGESAKVANATTLESLTPWTVSAEGNEVIGLHAGIGHVLANDKQDVRINVLPTQTDKLGNPIIEWGLTPAQVKARQKEETLKEETQTSLVYENIGLLIKLEYIFIDGKLAEVTSTASRMYSNEQLRDLGERYDATKLDADFYSAYIGAYYYLDAPSLSEAKTAARWVEIKGLAEESHVSVEYLDLFKQ